MNGVWALIPMKRFTDAKTRLRSALTVLERVALARQLSTHVLTTVLECGRFDGVLVLTNDSGIEEWSRSLGAIALRDGENQTLAQAIESGLREVRERGGEAKEWRPGVRLPPLLACDT